jgi:hypothetical protein
MHPAHIRLGVRSLATLAIPPSSIAFLAENATREQRTPTPRSSTARVHRAAALPRPHFETRSEEDGESRRWTVYRAPKTPPAAASFMALVV